MCVIWSIGIDRSHWIVEWCTLAQEYIILWDKGYILQGYVLSLSLVFKLTATLVNLLLAGRVVINTTRSLHKPNIILVANLLISGMRYVLYHCFFSGAIMNAFQFTGISFSHKKIVTKLCIVRPIIEYPAFVLVSHSQTFCAPSAYKGIWMFLVCYPLSIYHCYR